MAGTWTIWKMYFRKGNNIRRFSSFHVSFFFWRVPVFHPPAWPGVLELLKKPGDCGLAPSRFPSGAMVWTMGTDDLGWFSVFHMWIFSRDSRIIQCAGFGWSKHGQQKCGYAFPSLPPIPKYLVFLKDVEFYQKHMQCRSSCLGVMTSGGTAANIQAEIFGRSFVWGKSYQKSWRIIGKSFISIVIQGNSSCFHNFILLKNDGHQIKSERLPH